jgi:hypothetical protein
MGGYGSRQCVRTGKACTTEEALDFDLANLKRWGYLAPGSQHAGSYSWTNSSTGESAGNISYNLALEEVRGEIEFNYRVAVNGQQASLQYTVELETTSPNFGGLRWWFRCPLSARK